MYNHNWQHTAVISPVAADCGIIEGPLTLLSEGAPSILAASSVPHQQGCLTTEDYKGFDLCWRLHELIFVLVPINSKDIYL